MRLAPLALLAFVAAAPAGVSVLAPTGARATVSEATLAALPQTQVQVRFEAAHGAEAVTASGPTLWAVLGAAGAIGKPTARDAAHLAVVVTGADGYASVLALGEMSPDLEGKNVILALSANGKPLGAGHWRLLVPGEKHGARDVFDVVGIAVVAPAK
jgi:hypothetical protein